MLSDLVLVGEPSEEENDQLPSTEDDMFEQPVAATEVPVTTVKLNTDVPQLNRSTSSLNDGPTPQESPTRQPPALPLPSSPPSSPTRLTTTQQVIGQSKPSRRLPWLAGACSKPSSEHQHSKGKATKEKSSSDNAHTLEETEETEEMSTGRSKRLRNPPRRGRARRSARQLENDDDDDEEEDEVKQDVKDAENKSKRQRVPTQKSTTRGRTTQRKEEGGSETAEVEGKSKAQDSKPSKRLNVDGDENEGDKAEAQGKVEQEPEPEQSEDHDSAARSSEDGQPRLQLLRQKTVVELRDELRSLNLSTRGNKSELINRLVEQAVRGARRSLRISPSPPGPRRSTESSQQEQATPLPTPLPAAESEESLTSSSSFSKSGRESSLTTSQEIEKKAATDIQRLIGSSRSEGEEEEVGSIRKRVKTLGTVPPVLLSRRKTKKKEVTRNVDTIGFTTSDELNMNATLAVDDDHDSSVPATLPDDPEATLVAGEPLGILMTSTAPPKQPTTLPCEATLVDDIENTIPVDGPTTAVVANVELEPTLVDATPIADCPDTEDDNDPPDNHAVEQSPAVPVNAEQPLGESAWLMVSLSNGTTTKLSTESVVQVGRSRSSDVQIDNVKVSKQHCQLSVRDDGQVQLSDCSRNGTFVNGERLSSSSSLTLQEGDRLCFSSDDSFVLLQGSVNAHD